jgi:hypothetical protein
MYVADRCRSRWRVEAQRSAGGWKRSAALVGGSAAHSSNGPTGSSVFTMRIWPGKQNSNAACEMQL